MRSRRGYWIGGGLIVAGVLGAVLWFVLSLVRLGDQVDEFQRVRVPGEATVQLEAQKYIVYFEGANADEVVRRSSSRSPMRRASRSTSRATSAR